MNVARKEWLKAVFTFAFNGSDIRDINFEKHSLLYLRVNNNLLTFYASIEVGRDPQVLSRRSTKPFTSLIQI